MSAGAPSPRGTRALFWTVFVVLWGLMTHGTYAGSGDEPHYLAAAYSAAFDGDFDLSNNYHSGGTLLDPDLEGGPHVARGAGSILRPVHDIGLPLAFAPLVRIADPFARALGRALPAAALRRARLTTPLLFRHAIGLAMIALTALLAVQILGALVQFAAPPRAAWWWALLAALSPPIASHGFLFFPEVPAALLALMAFRRLHDLPMSGRGAALCGAAIGALPLLHARTIPIAAALVVLAAVRLRSARTELAVLSIPVALAVAARSVVTWRFWGTLVTTPHARAGEWTGFGPASLDAATRVLGWVWDREYGLAGYAPMYLLAVPGVLLLRRRQSDVAAGLVLVAGVYLAAIALPIVNVHGWTGGWSPAARFIVPVAPLLVIAAFDCWGAASVRPVAVVLTAAQVAMSALVWQYPKLLWNDGDGIAALCAWPALPQCTWLPSLIVGGTTALILAAAASAGVLVAAAWTVRRTG